MSRRFPTSASRLQLYRSNSTISISTPSPVPPPNHLFQFYGNPVPDPRSSLSPSIPPEKIIGKSHTHPHEPDFSGAPAQTPARERCSDSETYDDILRRCCYAGSCDPYDARSLHLRLIKNGFVGDLFLSNTLVNLYAKTGELGLARQLFDQMFEKNSVSWTCLISGHVRQGRHDEACRLFRSMLSSGFAPTQFAFGSVLRACQDSGPGRLGLGTQVHSLVFKAGYSLDSVVCNALISMYGGCCLDTASYARRVFDDAPTGNPISWNSIISVCTRRGDVISAYELFSGMQKTGFSLKPNEYTFGSLITATYSWSSSSSSFGLCLLDQMLSRIAKSGFLNNLYVGSALISAFARFGLLDKAKNIFLEMGEKNAISINGLMVGLVKQKLGEEAVDVFRETSDSVAINCDSYVVLLSACAEFSVPGEGKRMGKEIHGLVIRNNMSDYKVAVGNGLVNMYAKCGAIDEARRVFMLIDSKDLISWNSMISGLDQNGHFEEALMSFYTMQRSGTLPSKFTLISSLSSCASLGFVRLGAQVHCDGVKLGLDSDVSVSNSLLTLYGECGYMSECWKVFLSMPDHDLISWNSMIGALADSEASISESVGVFMDMVRSGWNPNRVTFINILAALSSLSVLDLGTQVHTLVLKYGVSEDIAVENSLLYCYAKCGEMDSCERLFVKMSDRRDDLSWNSMIAGYIDNGHLPKAMDFVWFMMHNGQKPDRFTFATVLSACASVAALERGMEVHAFGMRSYLESDVVVESALVDMYSKCGRVDHASKVFKSMSVKNEFSWNSMISGYARHGHGEKALELFSEMQQKGDRQPDHVTFVGVLSACSHVGFVELGLEYFESMSEKYGIAPQMEHYSCVVDLFGRAGKLDEMEDFLDRMPMTPNVLIWRTVLGACCRVKDGVNTGLGEQAGEMLLELDPQNPVNYLLISNMYASRGRWEDVAKARAAMRGAPGKKEAGCSWVTLKDGVHVFVAGDKSHPNTPEIYAELFVLNRKMRDAGYVPQTKFALYDLNMEDKEELLSYHSEKLAVAFVLTRSSSGLPIRIMKNLRVCGDCHSAFRYISKIIGRQIILRDSNRFHHFDSGKCSCGDYW